MYLENVVVDALAPQRIGRFWQAALGGEQLTDEPGIFETSLVTEGGPTLDLCFQPVEEAPVRRPRLHLDLAGGEHRDAVVERLLGLGARHLDLGQGDVPWVVLADPEGNAFCVMDARAAYAGSGPLAALPLDSAEPDADAELWSWLTGWVDVAGDAPRSLRDPSLRGPLLELCAETGPKEAAKNRLHLDLRLEAGDDPDEVAAGIFARGGRELHLGFGELPWRHYADVSGNEFCVLASRG